MQNTQNAGLDVTVVTASRFGSRSILRRILLDDVLDEFARHLAGLAVLARMT